MNDLLGKNGVTNNSVGCLIRETYNLNKLEPVNVEYLSGYLDSCDTKVSEFEVGFAYKDTYVTKFVQIAVRDEY